jgi:hypothetical protein
LAGFVARSPRGARGGGLIHALAYGGPAYAAPAADGISPKRGQVTGAFAEFERSMIRQRIRAGLGVIKAKLAKDGKFESKAGIVRSRLGRPGVETKEPEKIERARRELAKGTGIIKTAKLAGLGVGASTD